MGTVVVEEVVRLLHAPVDELLARDFSGLSGAEVVALVTAAEVHRNRLAAVDAVLLSALGEKAVSGEVGSLSPVSVLVGECRVAPGAARVRVRAARDLGPRWTLSGEVLAPVLARVAAALAAGAISAAHAGVIRDAIARIPPDRVAGDAPIVEEFLVGVAGLENPQLLRRTADELLAHLDPDGKEPDEGRSHRRRNFRMSPCPDGGFDGTFHFEAATGAKLLALLDSLAAPRTVTEPDGTVLERDQRSPGQRRHDAMEEMFSRLLRSDTLSATGGTPTTVLVRVDLADLHTATTTPNNPATTTDFPTDIPTDIPAEADDRGC